MLDTFSYLLLSKKMGKYSSDIRVSENRIDPNSKMVGKRDADNLTCFSMQEWCTLEWREIALNIMRLPNKLDFNTVIVAIVRAA